MYRLVVLVSTVLALVACAPDWEEIRLVVRDEVA